jgi:GNAT superfamily N-acetyltransferase
LAVPRMNILCRAATGHATETIAARGANDGALLASTMTTGWQGERIMYVTLARRAALGKPRRLGALQRGLVEGHFLSLEPEARHLRFGTCCRDAALVEYVRALDFDRDVVLGWFDADVVLGGIVHLARISETLVEFSISVLEQYRGIGYGQRMTGEAFEEAAKFGFDRAHVQFIAANYRMAAILDHYHATREQDGTERMVDVPLPARLSRPVQAPIGPFVPVCFD